MHADRAPDRDPRTRAVDVVLQDQRAFLPRREDPDVATLDRGMNDAVPGLVVVLAHGPGDGVRGQRDAQAADRPFRPAGQLDVLDIDVAAVLAAELVSGEV